MGGGGGLATHKAKNAQGLLTHPHKPQAVSKHVPAETHLDNVTLSIGAWLSGDMGTSAESTAVEAEGVLGVKLKLTPPYPVSYFVKAHVKGDTKLLASLGVLSGSVSGSVGGDFTVQ